MSQQEKATFYNGLSWAMSGDEGGVVSEGATLLGPGLPDGTNYTLAWSNVPPGVYSLTARATDAPNSRTSFWRSPRTGSGRMPNPTLATTRIDRTVFPSAKPK